MWDPDHLCQGEEGARKQAAEMGVKCLPFFATVGWERVIFYFSPSSTVVSVTTKPWQLEERFSAATANPVFLLNRVLTRQLSVGFVLFFI